MHWTKTRLKDEVERLRALVSERLRCALDDGNEEEVNNTLTELVALSTELHAGQANWKVLLSNPDDGALLNEEREKVLIDGPAEVQAAMGKYTAAKAQLQRASGGAAVGSAIARDVFNSAKAELDEALTKYMRPITELRRLAMEE